MKIRIPMRIIEAHTCDKYAIIEMRKLYLRQWFDGHLVSSTSMPYDDPVRTTKMLFEIPETATLYYHPRTQPKRDRKGRVTEAGKDPWMCYRFFIGELRYNVHITKTKRMKFEKSYEQDVLEFYPMGCKCPIATYIL